MAVDGVFGLALALATSGAGAGATVAGAVVAAVATGTGVGVTASVVAVAGACIKTGSDLNGIKPVNDATPAMDRAVTETPAIQNNGCSEEAGEVVFI